MKKFLTTFFCLGLVGIIFTGCKKTPEEKADWIIKKVTRKLELNQVQKEKLEDLKVAVLQARERHSSDKQEMFTSVKRMVLAEEISEGEVRSLIDKRQNIIQEEFPQVFPLFQAFHASLNSEQKKRAVELMDKFHSKRCHK
ncbi:Spy/CpxP family protein refolding chaperone [Bacteriovoracaceae bacterium]|nr:Spy/CpxP family protein refolding chaperone [Bacteriovoracaceae bacterium]